MTTANALFPSTGLWTREQVILALYWYLQIPFGQIHNRNKRLIEWAAIIGRNVNALSYKMVNLSSLDPVITRSGRSGLKNRSNLDEAIWNEYKGKFEQLTRDAESLLALRGKTPRDQLRLQPDYQDSIESDSENQDSKGVNWPVLHEPTRSVEFEGESVERVVKQRLKQQFFRSMVISNFDGKCCISGLALPSLLVASHIVGWADAPSERLNPHNGLALSALYDKAFDQHLLTLNESLEIMLSPILLKALSKTPYDCGLLGVEGRVIATPRRFKMDAELMQRHRLIFLKKISDNRLI